MTTLHWAGGEKTRHVKVWLGDCKSHFVWGHVYTLMRVDLGVGEVWAFGLDKTFYFCTKYDCTALHYWNVFPCGGIGRVRKGPVREKRRGRDRAQGAAKHYIFSDPPSPGRITLALSLLRATNQTLRQLYWMSSVHQLREKEIELPMKSTRPPRTSGFECSKTQLKNKICMWTEGDLGELFNMKLKSLF